MRCTRRDEARLALFAGALYAALKAHAVRHERLEHHVALCYRPIFSCAQAFFIGVHAALGLLRIGPSRPQRPFSPRSAPAAKARPNPLTLPAIIICANASSARHCGPAPPKKRSKILRTNPCTLCASRFLHEQQPEVDAREQRLVRHAQAVLVQHALLHEAVQHLLVRHRLCAGQERLEHRRHLGRHHELAQGQHILLLLLLFLFISSAVAGGAAAARRRRRRGLLSGGGAVVEAVHDREEAVVAVVDDAREAQRRHPSER